MCLKIEFEVEKLVPQESGAAKKKIYLNFFTLKGNNIIAGPLLSRREERSLMLSLRHVSGRLLPDFHQRFRPGRDLLQERVVGRLSNRVR